MTQEAQKKSGEAGAPQQTEADEYAAGFATATAAEQPEQADEQQAAGLPEGAAEPDAQGAAAPDAKEDAAPQAQTPPEPVESVEVLKKRLKDTQQWGTEKAELAKKLQRRIAEFEAGTGTQKQVDEARAAVDHAQGELDKRIESVRSAAVDYPEMQPLVDLVIEQQQQFSKLIEQVGEIKKTTSERSARDQHAEARQHFDTVIKPEILKVHPDYDDVLLPKGPDGKPTVNEDYFAWAEQQSPALRYAAVDSPDPRDMIHAMTEYKKYKGSAEVAQAQQHDAAQKNHLLESSQTFRGGGGAAFPAAAADPDKSADSYDAGYKLATQPQK